MRSLCVVIMFLLLLTLTSFAQQSTCDYKVEILIDGNEFNAEDFAWRMKATRAEGVSTNITGTAEIKLNGKTVKSYKPWSSDPISRQKTSSGYSPNLKPGDYEITAEIDVECSDTNKGNNIASKEIKINGEVEKERGNNDKGKEKEAATNEGVGDESTSGKADEEAVLVSTLQKATTKKPAESEETDNIIHSTTSNNKNRLTDSTISAVSAVQQPRIVYESGNEKAKGMVMVFLLVLSVLLNAVLIWKR